MDVYLSEYKELLQDVTEALEDLTLSDYERAVLLACVAELRKGLEKHGLATTGDVKTPLN